MVLSIISLISFVYASEIIEETLPIMKSFDTSAWILMDYASGKIIVENNADKKLDPASLTKIMTSYIIGQALKEGKIKLNDMVKVGNDAWVNGNPILKGSSVMFLRPEDSVSVADLNKGIIIQSGNDACIAIADYIAGSQESFVKLMNFYAKKLGLTNTVFKTVHGLDAPGQFSTARDMALLGQALIRDLPDEYTFYKEKEFTFNNIRQLNRNKLLWNKNLNVDGVKTGSTSRAGYNLITSATYENMRLISVILGARSDRIRFDESEKLLSWGFRFFENVLPIKGDANLVSKRVWFGDKTEVNLGIDNNSPILIPRGQIKKIKTILLFNQSHLIAPLNVGKIVGKIDFKINDKSIEQRNLIVLEEVREGNLFKKILDFILIKLNY